MHRGRQQGGQFADILRQRSTLGQCISRHS
jgi:hypothetical protein